MSNSVNPIGEGPAYQPSQPPDQPRLTFGRVITLLCSGSIGWAALVAEVVDKVRGQARRVDRVAQQTLPHIKLESGITWHEIQQFETDLAKAQYEGALRRAREYDGELPHTDTTDEPTVTILASGVIHIHLNRRLGSGATKIFSQTLRIDGQVASRGVYSSSYYPHADDLESWLVDQRHELQIWRALKGDYILPAPERVVEEGRIIHMWSPHARENSLDGLSKNILNYGLNGFSDDSLQEIALQMAHSVHQLHLQGYSHGDIHLGNFLVQSTQEGHYRVWITDFGLTRKITPDDQRVDIDSLADSISCFAEKLSSELDTPYRKRLQDSAISLGRLEIGEFIRQLEELRVRAGD